MSYGRPDVSHVIEYLQRRIPVPMEGGVGNRRFSSMLIDFFIKNYPESHPLVCCERLIDIALSDNFHRANAVSMGYIYKNRSKLIMKGLEQRRENQRLKEAKQAKATDQVMVGKIRNIG